MSGVSRVYVYELYTIYNFLIFFVGFEFEWCFDAALRPYAPE